MPASIEESTHNEELSESEQVCKTSKCWSIIIREPRDTWVRSWYLKPSK